MKLVIAVLAVIGFFSPVIAFRKYSHAILEAAKYDCASHLRATPFDLIELSHMRPTTNRMVKCVRMCAQRKLNVLKRNGKLNIRGTIALGKALFGRDSEELKIFALSLKKCAALEVPKEDHCEAGEMYYDCLMSEMFDREDGEASQEVLNDFIESLDITLTSTNSAPTSVTTTTETTAPEKTAPEKETTIPTMEDTTISFKEDPLPIGSEEETTSSLKQETTAETEKEIITVAEKESQGKTREEAITSPKEETTAETEKEIITAAAKESQDKTREEAITSPKEETRTSSEDDTKTEAKKQTTKGQKTRGTQEETSEEEETGGVEAETGTAWINPELVKPPFRHTRGTAVLLRLISSEMASRDSHLFANKKNFV